MRWLVCPNCRSELSEDGPRVACQHGHSFPVTSGVPRLIDDPRGGVIGRSFSEEWQALDYERDRSWGREVEKRAEFFLRHVGMEPDGLRGKVVLDVGCGHGTLSNELTKFGCQVVAADISTSVIAARQKFPDNDALHLVQADLLRSPFRSGAFDVVYAGGVLHHTPSTRGALAATVGALAPAV